MLKKTNKKFKENLAQPKTIYRKYPPNSTALKNPKENILFKKKTLIENPESKRP